MGSYTNSVGIRIFFATLNIHLFNNIALLNQINLENTLGKKENSFPQSLSWVTRALAIGLSLEPANFA